jgi:hypothetical protein
MPPAQLEQKKLKRIVQSGRAFWGWPKREIWLTKQLTRNFEQIDFVRNLEPSTAWRKTCNLHLPVQDCRRTQKYRQIW